MRLYPRFPATARDSTIPRPWERFPAGLNAYDRFPTRLTGGAVVALTTAINSYDAANDDIVAFDDYAPASGPILISDQTAAGFDAPSSGDASIGFVYSGDIDASTSKRVPAKLVQDEIHIEGARRVRNELSASALWTQWFGSVTESPADTLALNDGTTAVFKSVNVALGLPCYARVQFSITSGTGVGVILTTSNGSEAAFKSVTGAGPHDIAIALPSGVTTTNLRIGFDSRTVRGGTNSAVTVAVTGVMLEVSPSATNPPEIIDPSAAVGTHTGHLDSSGNETGTICAPGVAYFTTKNANTVDGLGVVTEAVGARIPDITGLTVREGATNLITQNNGTGWVSNNGTITTGQTWSGLDGFDYESNSADAFHRAAVSVASLSSEFLAYEFVFKAVAGSGFYINVYNYSNGNRTTISVDDGAVTESLGAEAIVANLGDGYFRVRWRMTSAGSFNAGFGIAVGVSATPGTALESHTTAGLKVRILGATAQKASAKPVYPGIINNTTGSTLARLAMAPELGIAAHELATRGAELVTNGGFDTDTDWTKGGTWTISGGTANVTSGGSYTLQQTALTIGKYYEVQFDVLNYVSGQVSLNTSGAPTTARTANGTYTNQFVAGETNIKLLGNGELSIDNVSVKEIIPNHTIMVAYQQPEVWPGALKRIIGTNLTDAPFYTDNGAASSRTQHGSFNTLWGNGSSTAGATNTQATTTNGGTNLNFSVNGGAVQADADADAYSPTFTVLRPGWGGGTYLNLPLRQIAILSTSLVNAGVQAITTEPS